MVAAAYDLSQSLYAVETLLANCAAFRTLMGAASVSAARDRCAWQFSRSILTPPFTDLMLLEGYTIEDDAANGATHSGSVAARMVWTELTSGAAASPPETRAKDIATLNLNTFGELLSQIAGLVGTSTYLRRGVRTIEPPDVVPDNKAQYAGCWDAVITFSWS